MHSKPERIVVVVPIFVFISVCFFLATQTFAQNNFIVEYQDAIILENDWVDLSDTWGAGEKMIEFEASALNGNNDYCYEVHFSGDNSVGNGYSDGGIRFRAGSLHGAYQNLGYSITGIATINGASTPFNFSGTNVNKFDYYLCTGQNMNCSVDGVATLNVDTQDSGYNLSTFLVYPPIGSSGQGNYNMHMSWSPCSSSSTPTPAATVTINPPTSTPYPLLDPMIWNAFGECPLCFVKNVVAWLGGPINTQSGNLSYQETDLVVPVAGDPLEFRRSYASNSTGVYTNILGFGWTHNYDMRLHFTNTATDLPNTVELQASGGSRLPFFIDDPDNPATTTYTPYPGVTAQLSFDAGTGEYLVKGFEQSTYRFNTQGRLIAQTDSNGNTINFTYVGDHLYRATQGGRYLEFSYYPDPFPEDRLHTVTDNVGRTVIMAYDDKGDLVSVTNPLSKMTHYEYNTVDIPQPTYLHKLTKVTDPSGRIVEKTAYDGEGRAYQQWDGAEKLLVDINYSGDGTGGTRYATENGITLAHTYDDRNTLRDTQFTCSDGTPGCDTTIDTDYDDNFKTTSVIDANNNPSTLKWNEGGSNGSNLEQVTNALDQSTYMVYNESNNNLEQIMDARTHTTRHTYHPTLITFRTSTTDHLGHTVRYTPTLNMVQNGIAVPNGLLLEQQDTSGIVTSYEYNEFGQVLKVTTGVGSSQPLVTQYVYDGIGRLSTSTQVSAAGSLTSLNVYNNGDQLLATIDNWTGSDPANWQVTCDTSAGVRDTNACTQYFYDDAGRITATTNTLGQTDLAFYDTAGRFSLSVGNYNGVSYDPAHPEGALCNFSNPDPEHNICTKTEYDDYGRVYTSTNSLGHRSLTLYDSLGRVDGVIQNSVNVTSLDQCSYVKERANSDQDLCTDYTYDAVGNVLITKDPAGSQTRVFYDELNRVEGQIVNWTGTMETMAELEANCFGLDPLRETDLCTTTAYDEVGNVILTTDPKGEQTKTSYNDINQVTTVVANWQPDFDPANCVYASANISEINICTEYGYDAFGRQNSVTNALEQTSLTVFDELGRAYLSVANWDGTTVIDDDSDCFFPPAKADENVCTVTYYDALGRQTQMKDALGNLTDLTFDGLSRMQTTTQYLDSELVVSRQQYDALGNRRSATDAEDHTTTFVYDSLNRLKTVTSAEGVMNTNSYNAAGWVLSSSNNYNYTTVNQYDALGRLRHSTDPEQHTTSSSYDVLGSQLTMTDAEGVVTRYQYNSLNRLAGVVENDLGGVQTNDSNILTQYQYDIVGNRTVIINARTFPQSATTYDSLNRPQIVKDALNNATTTVYDALGRVLQVTDGNNEVTTFAYDGLNRLITTTYTADNETVVTHYDAVGNRISMSDATGLTTYSYDDLYRPITIASSLTGPTAYGYDKVGNRTRLTYPDSRPVFYAYNDDNRLEQVKDWSNGLATYEYDAIGRLITTTLPNGVQKIQGYDNASRLTSLQHVDTQTGNLLAQYEYALDKVGNRRVVTETMQIPNTPVPSPTATSVPPTPTPVTPTPTPITPTPTNTALPPTPTPVTPSPTATSVGAPPAAPTNLTAVSSGLQLMGGDLQSNAVPLAVTPVPTVIARGISLSWKPSAAPSGTTFNVYRSSTLPIPRDSAHRISSGRTSGSLFDRNGTTAHFYVVTAQNAYGESGPSNTAQACGINCLMSLDAGQEASSLQDVSSLVLPEASQSVTDIDNIVLSGNNIVWRETTKLKSNDSVASARFGEDVALSGNIAVIGSYGDNDYGEISGSASVFSRDINGDWQETNLLVSDGAAGDRIGSNVAIDENIIVIGAPLDDNENGINSGSAYIFVQDTAGNWNEAFKLKATDGQPGDFFGSNVAISEDTVIVGATGDDLDYENYGSAYIFVREEDGTWTQQAKLIDDDGNYNFYNQFGYTVAISGDTAFVSDIRGSIFIYTRDAGIWNLQNELVDMDTYFPSFAIDGDTAIIRVRGVAHVYTKNNNGIWVQQNILATNDGDGLAGDVAIDGDTVIVGTHITGNDMEGSAYIFKRDENGNWSQQSKLTASDSESRDWFGVSVAIGSDIALVGSPYEDDIADNSGAVYVFDRSVAESTVTTITYAYDPLYRLIEATYRGDVEAHYEYAYDAVGNMETVIETIAEQTTTTARVFDAANQLTNAESKQAGTTSYIYDNTGNLIFQVAGINVLGYRYNQRNLLVEATRQTGHGPTSPIAGFAYDGSGNRVQQMDYSGDTPVTTTYANDPLGLTQVLLANNGTTLTAQLYGLDLIGQDDGTGMRTLLADGLGSVRQEMVGGAVAATTTYDPYGKLLAQSGTSGTVYGYTGEQEDAVTGLVYLRARYYNPNTNHFLTRDPYPGSARTPASQNGYSYVHGNPVNYTDPTGLCIVGYSGDVRPNQYPYGTNGICPNTEHWIVEGNAAMDAYHDSLPGPKVASAHRWFFGIDMLVNIVDPIFFGDVSHGTAARDCVSNNYVECWEDNTRLVFEDYDQLDLVQFRELENVVYDQLCNGTNLSDVNRFLYDTPLFNAKGPDNLLCYQGKCVPRSHINYFAQGAWSARLGESKEEMYRIIFIYKEAKHIGEDDYSVPQSAYDWAEYGYDSYLRYEQNKNDY